MARACSMGVIGTFGFILQEVVPVIAQVIIQGVDFSVESMDRVPQFEQNAENLKLIESLRPERSEILGNRQ